MDYAVFEARVMELLFKTGLKLTPQLAAFRVGCSVEVARKYLDEMTTAEILVMDVNADGLIQYDVPGRPAPTNEPLSWSSQGGASAHGPPHSNGLHQVHAMPPVHQHGVAPVSIQIHNAPAPQVVIVGAEKSVAGAALLGLFFGPLGMLYATGIGALIMFVISLVLIPVTLGLGFLFTAPACAIWGAHAASEHNKRLRQPAFLMHGGQAMIAPPPQQVAQSNFPPRKL